jgi:hypothetical protein
MKPKRLCVVTMIGPVDLIGDLIESYQGRFAKLERPCMIQVRPPNNLVLVDMIKGNGVITGASLEINMRNVLWIGEPTQGIRSAYQANRAGLIAPGPVSNNINVDAPAQ